MAMAQGSRLVSPARALFSVTAAIRPSGTMEEVKGDDSLEEVFLELEGEAE